MDPEIPANLLYDFDLKRGERRSSTTAGYKDTDGNGVREMPNGGEDIVLRLRRPLRVEHREARGRVRDRLAEGRSAIGTTTKTYNDAQLTSVIGKGDYDLFTWGWTPFVDPDPELSYFLCNQLASDPSDPTNYYNDANCCDETYDALYARSRTSSSTTRSASRSCTRC